ncbi:MAG: SagB/ThcOx family dehydrogenase [Gammaproteobacteria bacterium]|nr:SagB/ThcOx family dehydrogenase [Gammaproteobacteria bacterium]
MVRKKSSYKKLIFALIVLFILTGVIGYVMKTKLIKSINNTALPAPVYKSQTSIEEALAGRRSVRVFKNEPITLLQVSQLLWAAQGITSKNGFRTAPSAGAIYPLEIYIVSKDVIGLPAGLYHYVPADHTLELLREGNKQNALMIPALIQSGIQDDKADIVIMAVYKRMTVKYGSRGDRFVHMEAGHAAENIYLQAVSLGLGTVAIGSFDDAAVKSVLNLPRDQEPLYIMPIGKPAK